MVLFLLEAFLQKSRNLSVFALVVSTRRRKTQEKRGILKNRVVNEVYLKTKVDHGIKENCIQHAFGNWQDEREGCYIVLLKRKRYLFGVLRRAQHV